jgi:hypothetical protein
MDALQEKIKEYTSDGPPSVGQLIALHELAKKEGVKKNELEKLIDAAVASNKESYEANRTSMDERPSFERSQDFSFEKSRVDFPERRDLFDRTATEQSTAADVLQFNRTELNFGKVDLDFGRVKGAGTQSETTDNNSIVDDKAISHQDATNLGAWESSFSETIQPEKPIDFASTPPEHQLSYDQKISEIKSSLVELNKVLLERGYPFTDEEYLNIQNQFYTKYGLPALRSLDEAIMQQPYFEPYQSVHQEAASTPPSSVNVKDDYSQSQEEIERQLQIVKQKEEEKFQQKLEEKKLLEKQTKEKATRSTFEISKLIGSTTVLAWIAAAVSFFLFPLIGIIMGIITLSKVKEANQKVTEQRLILATEDVNKLRTARSMGYIAIFIGVGKLIFTFLNYGTIFPGF